MEPQSKESEAELYEQFKIVEQSMKSRLAKFKPTAQGLQQLMNQPDLPKLFEATVRNLLRDLTFSWKKTIDQRAWDIVKCQVNNFIMCQDLEGFVDLIGDFYKVRIDLFKKLVSAVFSANSSMQTKLGDQSQRMIVANLFYHYGQLLQNMQKTRTSKGLKAQLKTLQIASNLYFKAINLFPYRGKYYYLLAELTASSHDYFGSMYWCIRSESCRDPADCKKQLKEIFEKAEMVELPTMEKKELARDGLVWSFIRFFHQVSADKKDVNVNELLIYLRKFISYLKKQSSETELMLLSFAIQISLYSTYITVESMNLKRSYFQLKQNDHYRHTIKNSFLIIVTVLDMLFHTNHPSKLLQLTNLLLPVLAYLTQYPSTLRLLSQIFHNFDSLLINIYHTYLPHKNKFRCQFKIFDKEVSLVGWKMLAGYYEKHRAMEVESDNTMKVAWLLETIEKFQHVKGKLEDGMREGMKVKEVAEKDKDRVKRMMVRKDRTLIVADGRNIAVGHGKNQYFSAKGLEIVVKYWTDKGYPVLIILPDYCFDEKEIARKRTLGKNNQKTLPSVEDLVILKKFLKQQIAVGVPNSDYDDSYIIHYAKDKKAYILSCDGFEDIYKDERLDRKKRDQLREYLKTNCMKFTFIKDDFIPNPDFLKNKNMI